MAIISFLGRWSEETSDPEDIQKLKVQGGGRRVGIWEADQITYSPSEFQDWLLSVVADNLIADFYFLILLL